MYIIMIFIKFFFYIYFCIFRRLHKREIKWSTELNLAYIMLSSLTTHICKTYNNTQRDHINAMIFMTESHDTETRRRSHTNSSDLCDASITQRRRLGGCDGTWRT